MKWVRCLTLPKHIIYVKCAVYYQVYLVWAKFETIVGAKKFE